MPLPCQRPIAEGSAVRTMDYGEGGYDYRIHFAVTSAGHPGRISGPPEDCFPPEAPEWEITRIEAAEWNPARKNYDWVAIEKTHTREEIAQVDSWAEDLDLVDECCEALEGEREAWLEQRGEY